MPTDANGFEVVEPPEQDLAAPRDSNGFEIVQPAAKRDANGFEVVKDTEPEPAFFTGLGHIALAFPGQVLKGAATAAHLMPPMPVTGPGVSLPPQTQQMYDELVAAQRAKTPAQVYQEIVEDPLYQEGAKYVALAPQVTPEQEASKWTRAGETIGGFAPAAMGPLAPIGMGLQSVGEHITSDFDNAKSAGADDETAAKSAMDKALLSGGIQAGTFALLPPVLRGTLERYVVERFGQAAFARWLGGRVAAGAEGAALGGASTAGENLVEGQPLLQGTAGGAGGLAAVNLLLPWLREGGGAARPGAEPETVGKTPTPGEPGVPTPAAVPPAPVERPLPGQALLDEARAQREAENQVPAPAPAAADLEGLQAEMQRNQIAEPKTDLTAENAKGAELPQLARDVKLLGLSEADISDLESGAASVAQIVERKLPRDESGGGGPDHAAALEEARLQASTQIERILEPGRRDAAPAGMSDIEKAELQRQLDEELGQAAQPGETVETGEQLGFDYQRRRAQAAEREREGAEIPGREQPPEPARRNAAPEGGHPGQKTAAAEPAGALSPASAEAQAPEPGSDAAHLAYPRSALEQWADQTIAGSRGRLSAGLDPQLLAAHAVKGAFLLGRGVRDFAEWSAQMLQDLGETIKPHLPDIFRESIKLRREEITERLDTIATQAGRPGGLSKELQSQRWHLAKESRDLGREQAQDPAYVADLLRRMDKLGQDMDRARKAGNGLGVREAGEELRGLMEGELQMVKPDLLNRVYNDLVARHEIAGSQLGELPAGRTLGELATWVSKQLKDSPKVPLAERFNLAQQAADTFSRGKEAVTRLADRVGAAWQAFKEQYRHPTIDTDFRKTVKDWFYEKQWTGLEVERWLREIRQAMPSKLRRGGLSVWLDAGGDRQVLQSQLDLVPERFKRVWQAALNLTPGELALGSRIRAEFEGKLEDAKTLGLLLKGREDYGVPQVWSTIPKNEGEYDPQNRPKTPRRMGAKLDPRDPFFALERKNPSYFDGIMLGGVPKDLDIANLVGAYNAEFHNALADRGVIKALKDVRNEKGEPVVMISGGARVEPRGEPGERTYFVDSNWRPKEAVTQDGRPYQTVDHWALRDWKFASRDAEGNPIIVRGDFLVHPDHAPFLRNELGRSWLRDPNGGGKYFNWLLDSAAFLKASKFASATFHMVTLGEHAMFHAVMPIWRPGHGPELDPAHNAKLAGLMRQGGMDLGFGGSRQLFEEGLASHGGIFAHVPGLGEALGKMSDFLFKDYFPKLKAKTGVAVLERNLARYKGELSEDQIYELTASQMNAAFGGQNWKLLGTNKTLLDLNRLLLTAPDFFVSRAKVVAQALKPYHAEQRYFLLAQAALVYTAARALNMLFDNGDPHWEPENALSVVYNKRAYSARFLVNDIYHLVTDPKSFWQGRLGPLPRTAYEAIGQRDMRTEARISVPFETQSAVWRSAQIAAKDLLQWLVPVWTEGLLPGAAGKEQTGPGQVGLALVGVGSRKYTAQTEVYQWAKDFNRDSTDPAARLYQQQRDSEARGESAYRKLDALLDAGDTQQAAQEFQSLVAEGHRPQSVMAHYDRMQPFTGSAARERAFVQQLSATENGVYQRALQERRDRLAAFMAMLRTRQQQPAAALAP